MASNEEPNNSKGVKLVPSATAPAITSALNHDSSQIFSGSSGRGSAHLLVSERQKGNPLLSHIKCVVWEYTTEDIRADYVMGKTSCALFLSIKYHRLHPEYVYQRVRQVGDRYVLRVLLLVLDVENPADELREIGKLCVLTKFTLLACGSALEAARYIELYKLQEYAKPNAIQERKSTTYADQVVDFITSVASVNKSDALNLITNFGSLRAAIRARPEEIVLIPGWGEKKAQNWYRAVHEPFILSHVRNSLCSNSLTSGTVKHIPPSTAPADVASDSI